MFSSSFGTTESATHYRPGPFLSYDKETTSNLMVHDKTFNPSNVIAKAVVSDYVECTESQRAPVPLSQSYAVGFNTSLRDQQSCIQKQGILPFR